MKRALILVGLFGIAAAILLAGGWLYFTTFSPDRARYPVRGIDVSHHQGTIDWSRVAADDVSFAIIKATEGGDYLDEGFAQNLAGASAAGLAVGAYHFFTLCRPGAEQAANFLRALPQETKLLPPVVDLEYDGNCSARPSSQDVSGELEAFLRPVEAALGQQAIFYITYQFYNDHLQSLPQRRLWVRWIAWHPNDENWLLWQYMDRGRVDGIDGNVDLNVLQGDKSVLANLIRSRP